MSAQDYCRQLEGYGLATANILYRRPDHRWLLQTYVWQDYDLCPDFPVLNKFLKFSLREIGRTTIFGHGRARSSDQTN